MRPEDIIKVIYALMGGSAEPIGNTQGDAVRFYRQMTEEEIIRELLDDIYKCYDKRNVSWGSGKSAGNRAKDFMTEIRDYLDFYLAEDDGKCTSEANTEQTS